MRQLLKAAAEKYCCFPSAERPYRLARSPEQKAIRASAAAAARRGGELAGGCPRRMAPRDAYNCVATSTANCSDRGHCLGIRQRVALERCELGRDQRRGRDASGCSLDKRRFPGPVSRDCCDALMRWLAALIWGGIVIWYRRSACDFAHAVRMG